MKRRKTDPKKQTAKGYEDRSSLSQTRKAIDAAHKRLCGPVNWNGTSPKKQHPNKSSESDQV